MDTHFPNTHDQWEQNYLNKKVIEAITAQLKPVLPRFFGFHLLQIGKANILPNLDSSPIHHQIILSPNQQTPTRKNFVRGNYNQLPFLSESIDVVILPCSLEYLNHPKTLLQEVYRILIPNGKMIIIGFNPWSLWGLRRLFNRKRDIYPWSGKFLSANKVKKYLRALDCQTEKTEFFYHRAPCYKFSKHLICRLMELLFPFAGLYQIIATKQVAPLTPIKPAWKKVATADKPLVGSSLR